MLCSAFFPRPHLEDIAELQEMTSLQLQLCLQMALSLSAKRNEKQCKPWSLESTTAKLLIPELYSPVSAICICHYAHQKLNRPVFSF